MMAGCPADVLDIPCPDAALGGRNPQMGRLHLPGKERFEWSHSRPDQQQARIIVGNQGITGQNQMVFPSEKLQIFLSQFISGHALTSNWPNGRILKELYTIYRTLVNLPHQPANTKKEPFVGSLKQQMGLYQQPGEKISRSDASPCNP